MSNLLNHAMRELHAAGYDPATMEDGDINKLMYNCVIELGSVFANQHHSGASAGYCIDVVNKLLKFEPLSPLTGDDSEWVEVSEGLWQNNRCSNVFKTADGAYDIDGKVFVDKQGMAYTNSNSRVPVTFPYTPTTEYVEVDQ
jgi:hypothetical protein